MEIVQLHTLPDKIKYLTRTGPSYKILGDLEAWVSILKDTTRRDMGGCAMFAVGTLDLYRELDPNVQIYALVRPDRSLNVDHFVLYSPKFNMYFDSEGQHTLGDLIDIFGKDMVIEPWNYQYSVETIECDIRKIDQIHRFLDYYTRCNFVIIYDSDRGEYTLWTYDNKWIMNDTEINGIPPSIVQQYMSHGSFYIKV